MNYVGNPPAPAGLVLVGDTNPIGAIVWGHKVPDGSYLQLNGQTVSKTTYAALWAYAQSFLTANQTTDPGLYLSVDASTFKVPKLDGLFVRGTGQVDASHVAAAIGVKQADDNLTHTHTQRAGDVINQGSLGGARAADGSPTATVFATNSSGGTEARPVNVALVASVKALSTVMMPATSLIYPFELIEEKTASSSTSLDFVTGINSTYNLFQFELMSVVPATDDAALLMRFSLDGGASFLSGATDYSEALNYVQSSTNQPTTRNASSIGITASQSNNTVLGGSGTVKIFRPATGIRPAATVQTIAYRTTTAMISWVSGGLFNTVTSQINGVRFVYTSGNIAAGRIRLYGIR